MTTSFDTDSNTQTVAAGYDTEPYTETMQTVATAWASSPLGQPDREVGLRFAEPAAADAEDAEQRRPVAKHSIVALALAGGIGVGAVLGLMFFDFSSNQPAVAPGVGSPEHSVVVTEGRPSANDAPAPATVAPAPAHSWSPADAATPPASTVGGPSKAVDVPPSDPSPQPEEEPAAPGPQDPQDPGPQDPGPQDPGPGEPPKPWHPSPSDVDDITNPGLEPGPEPPAPADVPDDIALPTLSSPQPPMPDFDISAGS